MMLHVSWITAYNFYIVLQLIGIKFKPGRIKLKEKWKFEMKWNNKKNKYGENKYGVENPKCQFKQSQVDTKTENFLIHILKYLPNTLYKL